MTKDRDIPFASMKVAENHLERTREGRRLLQQRRSLREMTTPLIGLTDGQTKERRRDFSEQLGRMNGEQLLFAFQNTMHSLQQRLTDPNMGTSELEVRRILFEDEFRRRRGISGK